jgi:excisionase family DNA binding protein
MSEFLTAAQVAPRLGVSRPRIYQLMDAGVIPFVRRGRAIYVPVKAFDAWLEMNSIVALEGLRQRAPGAGRKAASNAAH